MRTKLSEELTKRIEYLRTLRDNWDEEDAQAPSEMAIALAERACRELDQVPDEVDPDAAGGVAFWFYRSNGTGNVKAGVFIRNNGTFVITGNHPDPVWQFHDLESAVSCINRLTSVRENTKEIMSNDSAPFSEKEIRRVVQLLWRDVAAMRCPWYTTVVSAPSDEYEKYNSLYRRWNEAQVLLTRRLYEVVFNSTKPTDQLLEDALDFLDGKTP